MKIALVHDWLTGMRGGEKCLAAIAGHFPEAPLYTLLHVPGSTSSEIEQRRIVTSPLQRLPGVGRGYRYLLPLMPWAIERLELPQDLDLVLSFSHAVAKGVRPPPGVPHVCYCFTPMRYAWHLREDYLGEKCRGGLWARAKRRLADRVLDRIRDWDRRSSERVTQFVAISQTIADRIRECYGRESRIVPPPVDTEFYAPDLSVAREDFYLCVSALVPYKRIDLAVEACARLGRKLIVVGSGPEEKSLRSRGGPQTEFLGWRTNAEIRGLLRRCRGLLFPGHEDFGIVPVEAMACGAPVIAYAAGGASETVLAPQPHAPGSGLFFAEQEAAALAETILEFERYPGRTSAAVCRRQALRFTQERFERDLLTLLDEAVGTRQRRAA